MQPVQGSMCEDDLSEAGRRDVDRSILEFEGVGLPKDRLLGWKRGNSSKNRLCGRRKTKEEVSIDRSYWEGRGVVGQSFCSLALL